MSGSKLILHVKRIVNELGISIKHGSDNTASVDTVATNLCMLYPEYKRIPIGSLRGSLSEAFGKLSTEENTMKTPKREGGITEKKRKRGGKRKRETRN